MSRTRWQWCWGLQYAAGNGTGAGSADAVGGAGTGRDKSGPRGRRESAWPAVTRSEGASAEAVDARLRWGSRSAGTGARRWKAIPVLSAEGVNRWHLCSQWHPRCRLPRCPRWCSFNPLDAGDQGAGAMHATHQPRQRGTVRATRPTGSNRRAGLMAAREQLLLLPLTFAAPHAKEAVPAELEMGWTASGVTMLVARPAVVRDQLLRALGFDPARMSDRACAQGRVAGRMVDAPGAPITAPKCISTPVQMRLNSASVLACVRLRDGGSRVIMLGHQNQRPSSAAMDGVRRTIGPPGYESNGTDGGAGSDNASFASDGHGRHGERGIPDRLRTTTAVPAIARMIPVFNPAPTSLEPGHQKGGCSQNRRPQDDM